MEDKFRWGGGVRVGGGGVGFGLVLMEIREGGVGTWVYMWMFRLGVEVGDES